MFDAALVAGAGGSVRRDRRRLRGARPPNGAQNPEGHPEKVAAARKGDDFLQTRELLEEDVEA